MPCLLDRRKLVLNTTEVMGCWPSHCPKFIFNFKVDPPFLCFHMGRFNQPLITQFCSSGNVQCKPMGQLYLLYRKCWLRESYLCILLCFPITLLRNVSLMLRLLVMLLGFFFFFLTTYPGILSVSNGLQVYARESAFLLIRLFQMKSLPPSLIPLISDFSQTKVGYIVGN